MSLEPAPATGTNHLLDCYRRTLCWVVSLLGIIAGAGLLTMVGVTTLDIVLRALSSLSNSSHAPAWLAAGAGIIPQYCGASLKGAYDIVKIAGTITIAAALPYTTAVKGHVAIEYFFHKLGRRGRIVVDSAMRLLQMTLFSFLTWQSVQYGQALKKSGEVSMTVQLPVFWVPYLLAVSCALVVLITFFHLVAPGKEMMKP